MPLTPEERTDRAHARGLKANNVQRRRYEKMLNEMLAPQARTQIDKARRNRRELTEQTIVLEVLDGSLERLVAIRQSILDLKAEAHEIATEATDHGLSVDQGGYSRSGIKYYTVPDENDNNPDACTAPGVVDYLRGFSIRRCENNPWYTKLTSLLERERGKSVDLDFDVAELSLHIWGKVSTEEIMAEMEKFKAKWVTFEAGLED